MTYSVTKMLYDNDYRMSKKQRRRDEKEKEPADLRETLMDHKFKSREDGLANTTAKLNKAMERHKKGLSKQSALSTRLEPFAMFNSMSAGMAPVFKRLGDPHVNLPNSPEATSADPNTMVVSPPRETEQRRKVMFNMSK